MTELGLTTVIVGEKVLCPGSINQPVTDTDSKQPGKNTKRISTSSLNRGEAVTTFQQYICEEDLLRKLLMFFFCKLALIHGGSLEPELEHE